MTISIRQIHPVFVGEVSGVDIAKPLSREDVAAIEAGMDRYAVLVFPDMPTPEARILLRDLNEHATQPKFVYVHAWTRWDLVIWDNRQTMHRVRRYDERQPRDMRRTTVAGDAPTTTQVEAA
jgi:alpha-ketoglutarate-dependent taurine dioxygenase